MLQTFVEYPFLCLIFFNRCHTNTSYIRLSLVNLCFTFSVRTHQKRFGDVLLHVHIYNSCNFILFFKNFSFIIVQAGDVRNMVFVSKSCRAPIKFSLSWIRAWYDLVYYCCLIFILFFYFLNFLHISINVFYVLHVYRLMVSVFINEYWFPGHVTYL